MSRHSVNSVVRSVSLLVALAVLASAPTALAQAGGGKKKVLRLDEFKVEGKIQKPQAFYILPRSNLNYEGLDRAETFLPNIVKSTESEPF